ncbi:MAG: hypothetical protein PVJ67_05795 [Candidatus Pacearchaeota archaeon]|jgi:hypothetical protein
MIKPLFRTKNEGDLFEGILNPEKIYNNIPLISKNDYWFFEDFKFDDSLINQAIFSLLFLPNERMDISLKLETRLNTEDFFAKYNYLVNKLKVASFDESEVTNLFFDWNIVNFPVSENFSKKDLAGNLSRGFGRFNQVINFMYDYVGCRNRIVKEYFVDLSQIKC